MTSSSKVIRYMISGLLIGAMWYLNRGKPAWEEVLRTVAVFTIVMAFMKAKLKRKSIEVHLVSLVASKASLVVIAAFIESRINDSVNNASLIISLGLVLAVTVLGPLGDRHFFTRIAPLVPAPAPAAYPGYPGQRF
jgi:peptidoglycan/LPS O-acetylase OafA/YrhL